MSHLFVHYFESKVERKCLLKYLISLGHTPPQFLAMWSMSLIIAAFQKTDSSFTEHVIQELSSTCADTKPTGIKATCIVSSDRAQPQISSYWKQQKPWQWPADKAMVILCVNILQAQSARELKACQEDTHHGTFTREISRMWDIEGEGIAWRGHSFRS